MKRFLPGIALGAGIAGLFCGSMILSCILIALATPALCTQIYEMTPSYKRKQKDKFEDFRNWIDYVDKLKVIRDNPTIASLRDVYYTGFASNIAYMLAHHPLAYKIADEEKIIDDINKLVDEAKNSCEWKILDDLEGKKED